jgi:hypothetical protein
VRLASYDKATARVLTPTGAVSAAVAAAGFLLVGLFYLFPWQLAAAFPQGAKGARGYLGPRAAGKSMGGRVVRSHATKGKPFQVGQRPQVFKSVVDPGAAPTVPKASTHTTTNIALDLRFPNKERPHTALPPSSI